MCNGGTILPCGLRPIAHGSVVRREAEQRPARSEAKYAPSDRGTCCCGTKLHLENGRIRLVDGDCTSRQALLGCLATAAWHGPRLGALARIWPVKMRLIGETPTNVH
jgi:hypothetical protein